MFIIQQVFVMLRSFINLSVWTVAQNYFLCNSVVLSKPHEQKHADTGNTDSEF